jgi:uncharacterized membrane protein
MKIRLQKHFDDIRSSYWFLPSLMAIFSILLSFITITLDDALQTDLRATIGFLWGGGPEGTRGLLETVAGSMITVAGVTFSVTMVALSMASSQFGSRLLRNFMADTGNQIVLGTFISTFLYSLLVLRTVRTGDDEFVPYISVTVAILLATASIGVLIYFIHHVALIMQAPFVVSQVAKDLFNTIDRVFPEGEGKGKRIENGNEEQDKAPDSFAEEAEPIMAQNTGYLQAVDDDGLINLSRKHDLLFKLPHRPGHFIISEYPIIYAWPKERLDDEAKKKLAKAFIIGGERTHAQDVEFAIEQLVELAVRALSTGINDPFTAISCIDWLGAALTMVMERNFPSPYRYDEDGNLRMIIERPATFEGLTNAAFNQIRQNAEGSLSVSIRLLEALTLIAAHSRLEKNLQILEEHADMVYQDARKEGLNPEDLDDLKQRYEKFKNRDFVEIPQTQKTR